MSHQEAHLARLSLPRQPRCPTCGVPMWLAHIDRLPQSEAPGDRYYYECIACDSEAVLFEAASE